MEVKSYESDKILEDLIIQFREDFESNNKSIISDLFYFEKITTMSCCNCHQNINKIEIMNKLVINLEEVRKYKSRSIECFTSLNIYDCLKYFVLKQ